MATSLPPKGEPEKRIGAHFAPLSVTQQEIPNMTVKVRAGSFFNTQDVFTEFSGGNTAAIVAPTANAKWVLVCVTDAGTLQLVDGVASASPSFPDVPSNTLPLAAVYVTSTTTSLTAAAVVDVRPFLRASNVVPDIGTYATIVDLNNVAAAKADVDGTTSDLFTLNKDQTGVPTSDASISINRGASPAVAIRWNETLERWEVTNDGTLYEPITSAASFAALVHAHVVADITDFTAATTAIANAAVVAGAAPLVHTHTLTSVTDVTAAAADVNQLAGVNIAATYETIANAALKANKAGDTFTGTVTVQQVGNQPISIVSSDAGSSGLMVERGVDPDARLEWDNTTESWLVGTTGSMNTVLTGAVIATKVDRAGDTMTGNLAMSNNKVTGLAAATVAGDAVRFDEFSAHNHDLAYEPLNANIQSHISDTSVHFTQAAISITTSQVSDFSTAADARITAAVGTSVQAYDADLGAIAALAGTSGFLTKTAADTWALDTSTYSLSSHNHTGVYEPANTNIQTHIGDATVHFTQSAISITSSQVSDFSTAADARITAAVGTSVQAYDADLGAIAALTGTTGFLTKTAENTWAIDTGTYEPANANIQTHVASSPNIHVDHTGVTLTAGVGLAGGGDISASRTFDVAALKATAALDFASITGQTTSDLTITVTGAVVGDTVSMTMDALEAGLIASAFVSAADTVTVRVANVTAGAIDPASHTFNVIVFQYGSF